MPRHCRMHTLQQMLDQLVIPVFNTPDPQLGCQIVRACHAAGALAIEFTNRSDFALEVFAEMERMCRREFPAVILGIGSIHDAMTAAMAISQGANFIVSPAFDEATARLCNRRKVPYFPGCGSVTEIALAEELGCEIVKIFPGAQVGGPAFIKAVLGPNPWSLMMPTGGVEPTEASLSAWLGAGAACVGIGSQLIDPKQLAAGGFDLLTENLSKTLNIAKVIKAKKP